MIVKNKKCSKCNLTKDISEFNKRKKSKDGYRYECKSCQKELYLKNREHNINKMKENRLLNIDEYKERDKSYYENNKAEILNKKKEYYLTNRVVIIEKKKKYNQKNKESKRVYNIKYREKNKKQLKEYAKLYQKKRRISHPHIFAWRNSIKSVVARLGTKKEGRSIDILGYSATDLKKHIEKQFTDGMTWDNYGKWHIDHIKGVSEFNSKTPLNIVNALSNLQPLWGVDNIRKG